MVLAARMVVVGALAVFLALVSTAPASLLYLYDFPGTPGSGLANSQTNPQPGHATFGDWSRVNLTAGAAANQFESTFWNNTSILDPTQYESFTITADAGYHLDLQKLTFVEYRAAGGPTKGVVQMFVNGSTTPWDVYNYNPVTNAGGGKLETFNFTPTTDADNVTSVEFRFYGYNGGTPAAGLFLDNVATYGAVVPEVAPLLPVTLIIACSVAETHRRRRSHRALRDGRSRDSAPIALQ